MPELPEVEIIRRGLEARIPGRTITSAWRSPVALRKPSPLPLEALMGRRIRALRRHAKVMFWDLDDGATLVAHLGMTGKFLIDPSAEPSHTHLRLKMDDGTVVTFSDPRRFGWLALHAPDDAPLDAAHYGVDALDPAFTAEHLAALLAGSRAPLKAFLLDQTKVAGLGNIYACEALWRAGLSPRRKACNTARGRIAPLREAIVAVLEESLAAGGTSFNDYVDSIGRKGSFLFAVAVFQREAEPCPRCGPAAGIKRIVQSGRSTFYCPGCQR
ncbi:MAG: bifunctional DNA-formamidopyrimidine glycosylase/DNA-(apurinic or apyrimidinic site) lyase [Thermoplasmatota archaeon]